MNYFKFLGTAATCPSANRNTSAIYFKIQNKQFLIDCGENTQRQILKFKENLDLDFIIITHMHADHFLGVFGLLETYKLYNRQKELKIYCSDANSLKKIYFFLFKNTIYNINFIQITQDLKINVTNECNIEFQEMDHTIITFGCYITFKNKAKLDQNKILELNLKPGPWCTHILEFKEILIEKKIIKLEQILKTEEKIETIFYSSDTKPILLKIKPTILIHESTYFENKIESESNKHTNLLELAEYIEKNNIKLTYITHISQRSENKIKKYNVNHIKIAYDGLKHVF